MSETKEQAGGFLKNVTLNGYVMHSQRSSRSVGGVALYVQEDLQHMMRLKCVMARVSQPLPT